MAEAAGTKKPVSGNRAKPTDESVLSEVAAERARQAELGYDAAHDDEYGIEHLAVEVSRRSAFGPAHTTDAQARVRLLKAAAMAVAAIEVIDRRDAPDERVDILDLAARSKARG